ncbi:hypothetical protein B7C51_02630 [Paenibacillus larvae subsp. pulvifaciens]|uniref:Pre-toxin TG domain-containing protein n=1 Tax=Paenibacillus larvae subsp. pulvifaciens TaxID=1477 RepID=A0A1V0UPB6_9BACL|nr:hypothetical protein B7C51_02630 [Paenibacillus larvae subsp. pulvifaciens]
MIQTPPHTPTQPTLCSTFPFVGSIKGAFEAFHRRGCDNGRTLSASDRWAAGIGSVLGTLPIPGAKQGGKYLTKGTIELEEQLEKSLVSAGTNKYRIPMDLQLFAGKAGKFSPNNNGYFGIPGKGGSHTRNGRRKKRCKEFL